MAHALAVGGAQPLALVRAWGGGAPVFHGPVEHVATRDPGASMNNECLYGLLHLLTELGGAAVLQAAAVGLHAPPEGGHGLVLALDGVAGVGKGVEEQDHAPAGGNAVVNGAGVAHPVVHKGYHHIGGIKGGGLGVPLHAKEQLSSASLRFSSFLIDQTQVNSAFASRVPAYRPTSKSFSAYSPDRAAGASLLHRPVKDLDAHAP